MAALTEAEKQKIIEEERVRSEARQKFSENVPKSLQGSKGVPVCQACGGSMKKRRKATGTGAAIALFLLSGLLLLIPFGLFIAPVTLIAAVVFGSKARSLWVCRDCGYQIEREEVGSFRLRR